MILVTGGTGFLGSELINQLIAGGSTVRAIKREHSVIPKLLHGKPVEWVQADLLNYFELEKAFEGITQVYHCAALVSFKSSDKKKLIRINRDGTANVVNLCLQQDGIKLVHASSVAALGDAKAGMTVTEKDFWEFTGRQKGYSISKYEAEMEVWRGIAEGLDAVIVNPSIIIGKAAGKQGSGKLFEQVKNGLRYYPGGSAGLIAVEDVAELMIQLMKSELHSQRFILNAETLTFHELFKQIAVGYGLKPPSVALSPWMLEIGWRLAGLAALFTGKDSELTKETAHSAFKKHEYSNGKIREVFPEFEFKKISTSIKEITGASMNSA